MKGHRNTEQWLHTLRFAQRISRYARPGKGRLRNADRRAPQVQPFSRQSIGNMSDLEARDSVIEIRPLESKRWSTRMRKRDALLNMEILRRGDQR